MRSCRPYADRMSDGTVRSHTQGAGPDRILAATGRMPDDWYSELDAAGGQHLGHTAIAAWLGRIRSLPRFKAPYDLLDDRFPICPGTRT